MPSRGRPPNAGWLQEATIRGHMLGKTMLPGDEELGKKDDDHRFAPARRSGWSMWNHSFRWRRKRTILVVLMLLATYMLLSGGRGRLSMGALPSMYDEPVEPTGPPEGVHIVKGTTQHVFDGPIRFYRLKATIRTAAGRTNGYETANRNILFAASSLKSTANLLPVVCEMSRWSRNHVHMAFMGREDIPVADLLQINGVDREKCAVTWHDARPDYDEYSSDQRAERAVAGALSHIHSYLHPQAIIVDDSISEDAFFVRATRQKTESLEMPLIEIPRDRVDDFMWLTRLDAGSLHHWHAPSVDILIQVPSDSSNVLRLLESIKKADYKGLRPPRVILDVPVRLDVSVKQRIENFKWPHASSQGSNALSVRRRIEKSSAVHHLELFYPASTDSHVLLLTPQAELSPLYFHYVMYALLEYKYSTFGASDSENMIGISLEQPSLLLDEKHPLPLPNTTDMYSSRYQQLYPNNPDSPFLWQAPNSHATLYFGNKWAELHSFITHRITKHKPSPGAAAEKAVLSSFLPGWIEPMLEFMRARGYFVLYPAKSRHTFVTIHDDLMLPPEDSMPQHKPTKPSSPPTSTSQPQADNKTPFLREAPPSHPLHPPKYPESPIHPVSSTPLHLALPFDGDLPEIAHLPQLLHNGSVVPPANASRAATEYANLFRREVGECAVVPEGMRRRVVAGEARDLFCFGDEDAEDWEVVEGGKLMVDVDDGSGKDGVVADEPDEF